MSPAELEALARRHLARLPAPQAPATLLPQVLAAIERTRFRSWYRRPWEEWRPAAQAASVATLAALVWLAGAAPEWSAGSPVSDDLASLAAAADILWRLCLQPVLGHLLALTGLMCLASAALCAALARMFRVGRVLQ